MMATVPHFTSGSGLRKFQTDGFLLDRVYLHSVRFAYGCHNKFRLILVNGLNQFFLSNEHDLSCVLRATGSVFCVCSSDV